MTLGEKIMFYSSFYVSIIFSALTIVLVGVYANLHNLMMSVNGVALKYDMAAKDRDQLTETVLSSLNYLYMAQLLCAFIALAFAVVAWRQKLKFYWLLFILSIAALLSVFVIT